MWATALANRVITFFLARKAMIVSFQHEFIFVKTRKTAGTSIEMALTPFCGPDDIVTPIDPPDERSRTLAGLIRRP